MAKVKQRVGCLKNFDFANEVTVAAPGINGAGGFMPGPESERSRRLAKGVNS